MATEAEDDQKYGLRVSEEPSVPQKKEVVIKGTYVTLTLLNESHMAQLWENMKVDPKLLIYMPTDPNVHDVETLTKDFESVLNRDDPIAYAVMANRTHLNPTATTFTDPTSHPPHTECVGVAFYGNTVAAARITEIGAMFTPILQRTAASTEIHYLLLKNVLDPDSPVCGGKSPAYRRVAWKCNRLNLRSRNAALRVGYKFEGTHRQAAIVKGRSRDDDMFSMIDSEWPAAKEALEVWLGEGNWDGEGKQRKKLQEIRAEIEAKMGL